MKKSAPIAKISRPNIKGVFERERLFRLLDKDGERPVVWVSGPAGSGKTTLVASWLDSRKFPCLWFRLDPGDADLSTFFYYLGMAGKKAAPRRKQPLPLLTPEYLMDVPTFSRRYFENLCSRVKPPFYIIFDNYQDVPADSAFHAVLAGGMTAVPEGVHAVFVSRTGPLPAFSGLIAGSKMELLGWDELQLTPGESGAIVRLHSTDKQDGKTLEWMYDRTRGWVAGVVLLARAAQARLIEHEKVDVLAPDMVFDYFASELFARTDEKVRDFLVKTSVLPTMTPAMAEQLTNNSDAGSILDGLNRRNYFIYKSLQPGSAYQYHPLFRDFLRSRVKETLGEDDAVRLQKRAAGLLEGAGQIEDAAGLYSETKDWEGLARLALAHALQLAATGRHGLLDAWLSGLPAEMPEAEPWLLYWKGICRFFVNPIESQAVFEKVFGLFTARRDAAGIFLSWSGVVESITIANENVKPLDHWIELLPELVSSHGGFPSRDIECRIASSMFAAIVMRQPAHPDMEKWLEMALLASDSYSRARTLFHLAMLLFIHGDEARWKAALDSFRRLVKTQGHFPLGAIQLKLCEAIYLRITGLPDLSVKSSEQAGVPWTEVGCKFLNAMLLHRLGEHAKADNVMRRAYEKMCSFNSNTNQYEYALCRAQFALDLGREQEAMDFLRSAASMGKQTGYHNPLYCLLTPQEKARICAKGLEWGIEPDFFREWIRRDGLMPEDPPLQIENWPWPLRINTLGRFELLRDDRPVNFSGKVQKPLEMLKGLIAFGGRGVRQERIIDALWPDAEGHLGHKSFETTLQRLRRLIGNDAALRLQNGRLTLDERLCWVDARAFEEAVRNAECGMRNEKRKTLDSKSTIRNRQSAIEKAVSLYRGHFLPADARLAWSAVARERLRNRFLNLIVKSGETLASGGQWKKAAELFEQGIEKDAACEEFYQQLMVCCKRLGQETRAAEVYNRCRMMLSQEFGLEPSSRTEELRRSLARPGR